MSQVHMNSAWTEVHMSQIDELGLSKFMILGSNGSWTVHGQPYPSLAATSDIVLDKVTTCHCFPPNVICLVSVRASILMLWIRPSESVLLAKPLPLGPNRRNYSSLYGLQISPWYGFWKLRLMSSGVNIAMTIASDCFSIQVNQPVQNPNTVSWVLIVADLWSIWPQIAASHVSISYIKMALLA